MVLVGWFWLVAHKVVGGWLQGCGWVVAKVVVGWLQGCGWVVARLWLGGCKGFGKVFFLFIYGFVLKLSFIYSDFSRYQMKT